MRVLVVLSLSCVAACGLIDTDASAQCEDWIKTQIQDEESYSWSETNWQTHIEMVTITFTSTVNGARKTQFAFCEFERLGDDSLRLKPDSSSIESF